jgi:hypothetical protein
MVRRAVMLFTMGMSAGVAVERLRLELRKPAAEQFPWLRARMNERVNPWLLEHRIPGSEKAEIATLEHVGRTSGTVYFTPVHPTLRDDTVLIPAPLGVGSHWARNAEHAGRARMQFHDRLYDLDQPELITVAESGMFPAAVAAPFDRMGWRYMRFHVAGSVAASFDIHGTSMPAGTPAFQGLDGPADMPIEMSTEIPIEPRMVTRDPASA